jgi:hypothetical protein
MAFLSGLKSKRANLLGQTRFCREDDVDIHATAARRGCILKQPQLQCNVTVLSTTLVVEGVGRECAPALAQESP